VIESCKVRSVFTPQDPVTAQWISDALGPKTEVHQLTTYTGHRLAPWLGHVMVSDQETSRPVLDAAGICKLPASDAILLVAGFPPIRAQRLRYYENPEFAARAALPPLQLKPGGPYPFRPRQHRNPWGAGKLSAKATDVDPAAKPTDQPEPPSEGSERGRLAIPLPVAAGEPVVGLDAHSLQPPKPTEAALEEQLDLLASEEELARLRAIDELERQNHRRPRGVRHRIPL
jgi:type IV secretion system protein VirD4